MAIVTRLSRKPRGWEQVWRGNAETLASIVAGRLESEGIRTRVTGSLTPYRTAALALGGSWTILVPAGTATRARQVLRDNDEGQNVLEEEDTRGLTSTQRATLRFVVLFAVALVAWAVIAAVAGPR